MLVRNFTPFPTFYFETEDHSRKLFSTFLVKASFELTPTGKLKLVQSQDAIAMADQHYGDPTATSVRVESDLCPIKTGTDIQVSGNAIAPGGFPCQAWVVSVQVFSSARQVKKSLRVTGPRFWKRGAFSWTLSRPAPTNLVELKYENAFGGSGELQDGTAFAYAQNPCGRGYYPKDFLRQTTENELQAPSLEAAHDPIVCLDKTYYPQSFGPVSRSWEQRLRYAGTWDDRWLREHWPHLPDDFDFTFYRSSHKDLQLNYFLQGNESILLTGFSAKEPIAFDLPEYRLAVFFRDQSGAAAGNELDLDTLSIDVHTMRVHLVWRIATPRMPGLQEIETRMLIRGVPPRGR